MKRIAIVIAVAGNTGRRSCHIMWRVTVEGDKTEDNEAANLFEIRVSVRRMRYVLTQAKSLCLLLEVRTLINCQRMSMMQRSSFVRINQKTELLNIRVFIGEVRILLNFDYAFIREKTQLTEPFSLTLHQ